MKETITSRVSRIISGSARKLVDILESAAPEIIMEEAIHEIDSAIYDVKSELGKISVTKHHAKTRLMEANKKHDDLITKVEFAIEKEREDLAEAAIAQQLDIEAQIPVLEQSIIVANEKIKELDSYISALQGKKREMRDELRGFRMAQAEVQSPVGTESGIGSTNLDDKVARAEAAFDRMMEKTTGLVSQDSADVKTAAQLEELEKISRENRIKERLASIKANMAEK